MPTNAKTVKERNELTFANKKALSPVNNPTFANKKPLSGKPISLKDSLNSTNKIPLESPSNLTDMHIKKYLGNDGGANSKKTVNQTNTYNQNITVNARDGKIDEAELERAMKRVNRKVASHEVDTTYKYAM